MEDKRNALVIFALFAALVGALSVSGLPFAAGEAAASPTGMLSAPSGAVAGAEIALWIGALAILLPIELRLRKK